MHSVHVYFSYCSSMPSLRFRLMHLQDLAPGSPTRLLDELQTVGHPDVSPAIELGIELTIHSTAAAVSRCIS
jgi:hypothetical protein